MDKLALYVYNSQRFLLPPTIMPQDEVCTQLVEISLVNCIGSNSLVNRYTTNVRQLSTKRALPCFLVHKSLRQKNTRL